MKVIKTEWSSNRTPANYFSAYVYASHFISIILAVDRRSRISTSIFTSGRSHQYLWSNNCISPSSLCSYIARQTLFI